MNNSFGKNLAALCYLLLLIFLGVSAARQGLSNYYAERALLTGSHSLADAANSYEPENPNAHKSIALISLNKREYSEALASLERAISLRSNDFLLWLHLGYCRLKLNDFDSAYDAYERALFLAPNYSEPNYYMGKALLENGQPEQGFRFLSKAAKQNKKLYPEILHLAGMTFPNDPQAIEKSLSPTSYDERKAVVRYLTENGFVTDSVRSLLIGDELNARDKNEFVQHLIGRQNFLLAREVWASMQEGGGNSTNNLMFDGGFEKLVASDETGFGWRIDQKASALSVALDESEVHSGSRSIRIKFAGNVEFNRRLISQLVPTKSHHRYQLRLFLISSELTSAGLPAIVINEGVSDEILGRSNELQSTKGKWVEIKIDFVTRDTPAVTIDLQRLSCDTSPCPIFGELVLDEFSLTEI